MKGKNSRSNKSVKDRTRNDKGILLEQIVAMLHKDKDVKVETNVKLTPKSGDTTRKREIDVLLISKVAGYSVRVAIQCRNYKKKITIDQIGDFRDLLEDVGIPTQHGIFVSINGFQSGAIKRAKELGIKTFVLEGLDKSRLKAEIQETLQFFVYLLLVVEEMSITSKLPDIYAWGFWDEDRNFSGFLSDLIVSQWRNGEIPMKLGEYSLDLKLPQGWHQILNDEFVYPYSMSAKVRIVGYLAEMSGKAKEFKLKDADTNNVEKFHMQANFDVINNLIKLSQEAPIFTEEELKKSKKGVKVSIENRIRLPKIFVRNHLEPFSQKTFDFLMKGIEDLTLEEISQLPQPTFEEVEGDTFAAMQERAAMGEPVIISNEDGILIDVRLLFKQGKFNEIVELFPLLQKFPRKDFAEYLSESFLLQGEAILNKSLQEEISFQKVLEQQAFSMFDKAIRLSSQAIDIYLNLGMIFRKNKFYDKSIQCFQTVISAQPQNAIAKGNLAETYFKMGNLTTALNIINKTFEEIGEIPLTILLLRAQIFATEKRYREAAADLIQVWKLNYQLITERQVTQELVYDVYNNFKVIGVAIIVADIYLHYVHQFTEAKEFEKSKKYLDLAVTLLESINKACDESNLSDFKEESLKPVLLEINDLLNENPFYSTEEWKIKIQPLIQNLNL